MDLLNLKIFILPWNYLIIYLVIWFNITAYEVLSALLIAVITCLQL